MPPKKYATEEERKAAKRQNMARYKERHKEEIEAKKAAKLAAKEHLRTPKGGYFLKFASVEEQRATAKAQTQASNRKIKARRKAANAAARAETAAAARIFIRDVAPLLTSSASAVRTRLFIALSDRGPMSVRDAGVCASRASAVNRAAALEHLVKSGILAKAPLGQQPVYYLNPGHPAHAEVLRFGQRLAMRWPSPPRRERRIAQVPVRVPTTAPCNLFGSEVRTRTLLLIAVSGGMAPSQAHQAGFMVSGDEVDRTLRGAQQRGVVAREPVPIGRGAGQGQARRYFLDPEFFAYEELRAVCFALAATLYDDIVGTTQAMAHRDARVRRHLEQFKEATAHLRDWTTAL